MKPTYLNILEQLGTTKADFLSGIGWSRDSSSPDEMYRYGLIRNWMWNESKNLVSIVTRDIFDVLESVTLKYDDGRVEHPDLFKVTTFHVSKNSSSGKFTKWCQKPQMSYVPDI